MEIGAFCRHAHPERKGRAAGPLQGLTFAAKDVIAVEGVTACYGNPTWLATHSPAPRDAHVVTALLAAGADLKGVTLTDELALSLTGENAHYGTPLNSLAPERVPGGSSSGSASAVAAGLVDFALGTDTGGSVRVPASHCGLFGIRPTLGAVSTEGVLPLASCFDTVGWFARSAELLAKVGSVLLPSHAPASAFERCVILRDAEVVTDRAAWDAFRAAAPRVAGSLSLPLSELHIPPGAPPLNAWIGLYITLQGDAALRDHRAFLESRPPFGSLIGRRFGGLLSAPPQPSDVTDARAAQGALFTWLGELFATGACVLLPSAPGAAPLRGLPDDTIEAYTGRGLTLAALASLGGLPQISLPLLTSENCPLGLSILGPPGSDRSLLELAQRMIP